MTPEERLDWKTRNFLLHYGSNPTRPLFLDMENSREQVLSRLDWAGCPITSTPRL